jgi:hypothetical protein
MNRLEGYYWVKYNGHFEIALFKINQKLTGISYTWYRLDSEGCYFDNDFDHINEVRIKYPGEFPD